MAHLMRGFTFRGCRIYPLRPVLYIRGARLTAPTFALCHRLLVLSLRVPAHEREKKTKEKEKEQIVEVALRHKPNLEKVIWTFSYIYRYRYI